MHMKDLRLCFLGPFQEVLRYHGQWVPQARRCGIGSGPAFEYAYIHDHRRVREAQSEDDWVSIVGSRDLEYPALRVFGQDFQDHSFESAEHALAILDGE